MVNNAALNIFVHIIFFFWIISLGKIPRSGITGSKGMNILWLLICASRIFIRIDAAIGFEWPEMDFNI